MPPVSAKEPRLAVILEQYRDRTQARLAGWGPERTIVAATAKAAMAGILEQARHGGFDAHQTSLRRLAEINW